MNFRKCGFCSLALALLMMSSFVNADEGGIEVSGTAEVSVVPDLIRFSFSISGLGKDLAGLKAEIDQKTAALVMTCKRLAVKPKYISSSEVLINPQYNYQTKAFIGYEVSRNIKVTLEEIAQYTALMRGAIEAGITTIQSVTLDVRDRKSLERKALAAAIDEARQKAEILADSTGVRLGKLIYVKEGGARNVVPSYRFQERALSQAVEQGAFEPGEILVTASVAVKYAIR